MSEQFYNDNNATVKKDKKQVKVVAITVMVTLAIVMLSILGVASVFIYQKKDTINQLYTVALDEKSKILSVESIAIVKDNYVVVINDHGKLRVALMHVKDSIPVGSVENNATNTLNTSEVSKEKPVKAVAHVKKPGVEYTKASSNLPVDNGRFNPAVMNAKIDETLVDIPCLTSTPNLRKLILETMVAETELAQYVPVGGGAYGNVQMLPSTCKYLIQWMKKNETDSYHAVMDKYDRSLSIKDNLATNLSFQIAMCAMYYYHRTNGNLAVRIATLESRSKLWKNEYNTYLGKGTPKDYVRRVNIHLG